MFTGDGSLVFFDESAGLSYTSVSLLHSSLETDLSFSVLVAENGTASEGIVKFATRHYYFTLYVCVFKCSCLFLLKLRI